MTTIIKLNEIGSKESKYIGTLLGGAIGDALGWPAAEKRYIPLKTKHGVDKIKDYISWESRVGGKFNSYIEKVRMGEYTDDTQLTLCTARCIRSDGSFDVDKFSKKEFPLWLDYARAAGMSSKHAANNLKKSKMEWHNNFYSKVNEWIRDYRDSGSNGAAMRIAPLALVSENSKLIENIWINTIVSHGHPRAIIGALLQGYSIHYLKNIDADKFERDIFKDELINFISTLGYDHENIYLKNWLKRWNQGLNENKTFNKVFDETKNEVLTYLDRFTKFLDHEDKIVYDVLGCSNKDTMRSGTGTTIAGSYMFYKYYPNPENCLISTINMIPSDSDTIGSFVGQLLGALYGVEAFPARWVDDIQDKTYLTYLGKKLYAICTNKICLEDKPLIDINLNNKNECIINYLNFSGNSIYIGDLIYHPIFKIGKVIDVDLQDEKSKSNLFLRVQFQCGQSVKFRIVKNIGFVNNSKITDYSKTDDNLRYKRGDSDILKPMHVFENEKEDFSKAILQNNIDYSYKLSKLVHKKNIERLKKLDNLLKNKKKYLQKIRNIIAAYDVFEVSFQRIRNEIIAYDSKEMDYNDNVLISTDVENYLNKVIDTLNDLLETYMQLIFKDKKITIINFRKKAVPYMHDNFVASLYGIKWDAEIINITKNIKKNQCLNLVDYYSTLDGVKIKGLRYIDKKNNKYNDLNTFISEVQLDTLSLIDRFLDSLIINTIDISENNKSQTSLGQVMQTYHTQDGR